MLPELGRACDDGGDVVYWLGGEPSVLRWWRLGGEVEVGRASIMRNSTTTDHCDVETGNRERANGALQC